MRRLNRLALVAAVLLTCGAVPAAALASGPAPAAKPRGHTRSRRELQLVLPLVADDSGLQQFAQAVSTPGSAVYGQYESIAQLSARFGATPRTRRLVTSYLRGVGAKNVRVDATGLFVDATVRAGKAQKLFRAHLERVDVAGAQGRSGATSYTAPSVTPSIPGPLRGLVTGVVGLDTQAVAASPDASDTGSGGSGVIGGAAPTPTTTTPATTPTTPTPTTTTPTTTIPTTTTPTTTTPTTTTTGTTTTPTTTLPSGYTPATGTGRGCQSATASGGFTPNQYLTAYGYTSLQQQHLLGQGERVALIEIDGFKASDIGAFAKCFGLHVPRINPFGVGLSKPLAPGGEATLDIEVLDAAAPYLKAIDVYESRPDAANVLEALTDPLQHAGFKPQVISASLGLCEAQTREAVGMSGIKATEAALAEATASGISVLAASGDSGSSDCINGDSGVITRSLAVNYPASSQWVTSVGGTNLALTPANAISNQVVWNDGSVQPGDASGGGFSTLFPRPSYQHGVVKENRRAIPDVALLADIAPGYDVYCTAAPDCINAHVTDAWQTVGGTSAATPFLAGGFALLDQDLRRHEQQSLGLVNPLLYNIGRSATEGPHVFDDVTEGSNDVGPFLSTGAGTLSCCTAATGFDEASGWGGVNLSGLATAALKAEPKLVNVSVSVAGGQAPYADKGVKATVGCSGACEMGAYAIVTIGNQKPFTDFSPLIHLPRASHRTVKVTFKDAQLQKIATGLQAHDHISLNVAGAIIDAGGNIERSTSPRKLTITH